MTDYFDLHLSREEQLSLSALGMAHLGDGVYELMVRSWLILQGFGKKGNLHRETVARVRASYQAKALARIEPLLTAEETAVEALFGYLYLNGRRERLNELFEEIMKEEDDAT